MKAVLASGKVEILYICRDNRNAGVRVLVEKFQVGQTQIANIVSNKYGERYLTNLRKCEGGVKSNKLLV